MNKKKTYATVCSGIGAPEVACGSHANGLGWRCLFSSEIEAFPNAVREHHFPGIPNFGDMTQFAQWPPRCDCAEPGLFQKRKVNLNGIELEIECCAECGGIRITVLIGGTPCQSFSVAGLRAGLADPRGNLTLTFLGIVERYAPRWVLWENVPGILSIEGGKVFAQFLGGLCGRKVEVPDGGWQNSGIIPGIKPAFGLAYAILDAQYFGVAQRRRRVFVVGHSGGLWQRAAAVLFDRESLCGNPAPRRQKREGTAHAIAPSIGASGRGFERTGETRGQDPVVCATITKNYATHHGRTAGNNGGVAEGQIIPIQEVNKRTGISTSDKSFGIGIGDENDPMFTLQKGAQHGVAFEVRPPNDAKQQVAVGIDGGDIGFALRSNPSHSGDKGDGGVNTTLVAATLRSGSNSKQAHSARAGDKDENLVAEVAPCIKSNRGMNSDPSMEVQSLVAEKMWEHGRFHCQKCGTDFGVNDYDSNTVTCPKCKNTSIHTIQDFLQDGGAVDVSHSLRAEGFDASEDGTGRGTPLVPEHLAVRPPLEVPELSNAICQRDYKGARPEADQGAPLIPISGEALGIPGNWIGRKPENGGNAVEPMHEVSPNLTRADRRACQHGMAVRRLTPRECERLQGFPDDFTLVNFRNKPACDGPRYKALGNSMAVPVIRWICSRMDLVDELVPLATAGHHRRGETDVRSAGDKKEVKL